MPRLRVRPRDLRKFAAGSGQEQQADGDRTESAYGAGRCVTERGRPGLRVSCMSSAGDIQKLECRLRFGVLGP